MESLPELLTARFGADAPALPAAADALLNETLRVQLRHRSIRKFKPDPLSAGLLEIILAAAQSAPTSSNLNAYTILVIESPETKIELARLTGGQAHVAECPVFLLFCPDIHRLARLCERAGAPPPENNVELLLLAAVDAALAGMNAMTAAESAGLGAVMIGGVRDAPAEISRLLHLPDGVFPLFGLCLGWPAEAGRMRLRPAPAAMVHREKYQPEVIEPELLNYRELMQPLFSLRALKQADGSAADYFSHTAARLQAPAMRGHMRKFLTACGFALR